MIMSTVSVFDSAETGAPSLSTASGSMIEVLLSCLVNGFNSKAVSSIQVTGNMAIATSAAHGFLPHAGKLITLSGVAESGLNGAKQPTAVTTNTFTFAAPGVADGTYSTGGMTAKRAGLGWERVFTGTEKAVFRPLDPSASRHYLRVSDPAGANARVIAYAVMSDIDTGTEPFPTEAQVPGGFWWSKANNGTGTRRWVLVGDARTFYLFVASVAGAGYARNTVGFGDFKSFRPGNPYACFLNGSRVDASGSASSGHGDQLGYCTWSANTGVDFAVSRALSGAPGAAYARSIGYGNGYNGPYYIGSTASGLGTGPFLSGGFHLFSPLMVAQGTSPVGRFRGLRSLCHAISVFPDYAEFSPSDESTDGRTLVMLGIGPNGGPAVGVVVVDVTGPWSD